MNDAILLEVFQAVKARLGDSVEKYIDGILPNHTHYTCVRNTKLHLTLQVHVSKPTDKHPQELSYFISVTPAMVYIHPVNKSMYNLSELISIRRSNLEETLFQKSLILENDISEYSLEFVQGVIEMSDAYYARLVK